MVKYIKIIIIVLFILILAACSEVQAIPEPVIETVIETVIVTETVEIENTERIDELEIEVQQYKDLIGNLNEYLGNVYYGWAINSIGGTEDGYTAFTIFYKDEYYIITAGHAVENEHGKFSNFKFRAKFSDIWIYPKLLTYDNNYMNEVDYAIFISSEIVSGFNVDLDNDKPLFIIGGTDINTISDYYRLAVAGESGSPIIDVEGEVTEIVTTSNPRYNTDINIVIEAINNLE